MAKRLQLLGDFPSESTIDEEAVRQIVTDCLSENPPASQIVSITIEEVTSGDSGDDSGDDPSITQETAAVEF